METLLPLYDPAPSPLLAGLLDTPPLRRLADVGMNCGCEYTVFPLFARTLPYSRRDHSAGAARIVWHFTASPAQAAAALLHLPLSDAIMWGVLISIPSVFAAGLYCLTLKEPVAPQDEYIKSAEASKDKPLPSVGTSLAPIILPLVLIFLNTGINAMFPDTTVAKVFKFVGSPLAALLAGCLFSLVLTGAEWRSKKVMNDWVESALRSSAMPIMVTAMGGALAAFIKNAGVANAVAETVVQFSIPGIIIPILIAALIHVITGSNALGVMTAAALVEPMLGALGISPLAAFLACGTGALMFKHANSSGFWVTVTMSNMDIRQGIRAVGGGSTVAGVTGAAITVILHFAGII